MAESTLYKTALNKAMSQCSQREYCSSEIVTKLESWGITGNDSNKIIDLLIRENFINEERYACAFARDKFRYNKWGKIKIAAHFRAKKIPAEAARTGLESIDNELYLNTLKALIESHRRSIKAKNQYDLKAKLLRFGLSKGFESSLLYEILNADED
ncbi:MAG: RecX family transcriptional regulator [Bacteroidetes bacterium]|nr:RecX family transcriptional regulator [Bacteroidota bacterium]